MQQQIILFRHGSVLSKKNIFCGWINLPLNDKGLREAKIISKRLKGEKIGFVFCSDQLRSQQVALEILKNHPCAKAIIDPRLRERHYGALTGVLKDVFRRKERKLFEEIHRGYDANIPEGENLRNVAQRVFPFVRDLLDFMQKEKCSVAISAHTNSLRLIQEYLEGLNEKEVERLTQRPTEYKKYLVDFDD